MALAISLITTIIVVHSGFSRAGLGYLAIYGGQVLNMHLVMTSVFLLALAATVMFQAVALLEQKVRARHQNE